MVVVVGDVVGQHLLQMTATEDQHPVQTLSTHRTDETLCEGVGPWSLDRGAYDPDALGTEDLVEARRELRVSVSNEKLDGVSPVGEHHGEVAGLLDSPRSSRVSRDPRHVHPSGVELDEEQHVEALKSTVSTVKKSQARADVAWLRRNSFQPGPVRIGDGSTWCRCRMAQTLGGAKADPHPCQFTLDPTVAPGGILLGQPEDDRHGAGGDARPTRAMGIDPFTPDEVPMPAEQGLGLHQEPASTPAIKQPTQSGEQSSIGRPEGRSGHLATEYGNLVSEHDDFNGQLLVVAVTEEHQLEESDEGEVEKRQGHGPVSSCQVDSRKS